MKLFLDTAEFDEIKQGVDWGVVDGVTTNPTLIAKAGQDYETQVKKICGIMPLVAISASSVCRQCELRSRHAEFGGFARI